MRQTLFAEAQTASVPVSGPLPAEPSCGQLRCPQGATLYPQERRPEHDGTLRVLYAARLADCRSCPLRAVSRAWCLHQKAPSRQCCPASSASVSIRRASTSVSACKPIRSSGTTGRDVSHAGHGCSGSETTWSPSMLNPLRIRLQHFARSHEHIGRIGV